MTKKEREAWKKLRDVLMWYGMPPVRKRNEEWDGALGLCACIVAMRKDRVITEAIEEAMHSRVEEEMSRRRWRTTIYLWEPRAVKPRIEWITNLLESEA